MKKALGEDKIRVGISLGDINGIGPEIILKTFADPMMLELCTPIVYGSSKVLSFYKKTLDHVDQINYQIIHQADEASLKKLNIINCWQEEVKIEPGVSNEIGAQYAIKALDKAMDDLNERKIHCLVTAPIDKSHLLKIGFHFPGHTEYVASKSNGEPLMLMVHENLRVALVTGHLRIKEVADKLSENLILDKLNILNDSLKLDFSIRKPKIAVLGLNPHAGDQGKFGNEEQQIIIPAIKKAFDRGILAMGPFSADGFFASGNYKHYDAILAMYHDQGLIPFKTISGMAGVNYTAGLNVIRTSPDHGPAFDLAGKGIASEESFRQSVYIAMDIYATRKSNQELLKNPLKKLSNEIIEGKEDESIPDTE
ncbi:MAG: 4-hydroxythreonine-4-phosphate dehydrogenase PdxA [Flavobacteriales bacterium]|nr:4-hydroxythreonine-4-phosphate dehydrogenase PdxA [Flavobacteriales bacterium]